MRLGFWRGLAALILAIGSMISETELFGVTIQGGPTLLALGAVFLLWPFISLLAVRGGAAEFFGLKVRVNELEQRSEGEIGLRIAELSADVEAIRARLDGSGASRADDQQRDEDIKGLILEAARDYAHFPTQEDWLGRVTIDKRLIASGPFPAHVLRELARQPKDHGTAMAIAVALGTTNPGSEVDGVEPLAELLAHRSSRVRFRAAQSTNRLLRRRDLPDTSRTKLIRAVRTQEGQEDHEAVLDELRKALQVGNSTAG